MNWKRQLFKHIPLVLVVLPMLGAGLLSITNAQTIAADFVAIDAYVQQQVDVSHIAGATFH